MKKTYSRIFRTSALLAIFGFSSVAARAQYAQIINQIPSLITPALSGSMSYRGYVDATATFGVGDDRANFVGISTTQGYRFAPWFFMGAGIGVDVAMSSTDSYDLIGPSDPVPGYYRPMARTKAMIPVFSDFRFNFGNQNGLSFFADIKAGATWLIGSSYLELNNGALSTRAQFLLRPSIGVRIPVNKDKPRQAVNIGFTYQLITANSTWGYINSYDTTINSLGLSAGFEW